MTKYITALPTYLGTALAIDLETTMQDGKHSNPHRDNIIICQIATQDGSVYLIRPENIHILASVLEDKNIVKIFQNGKFDSMFLYAALKMWPDSVWDTLLMERLLTRGLRVDCGLDAIALRRMNVNLDKSVRESFGKWVGGELTDEQLEYAAKDAQVLPTIMRQQIRDLEERGLLKTAEVENKLMVTTAKMEYFGVPFNAELWDNYLVTGYSKLQELNNHIQPQFSQDITQTNIFGTVQGVNIKSHQQLLKALNKKGIKVGSTREEELRLYIANHPKAKIIDDVLLYRSYAKMVSWKYERFIDPTTGNIHGQWNQLGTFTGRYSCKEPNLMQVTRATAGMPNLRKLFMARPGYVMITADYSQQEIRFLAQISGDENLREVCASADMHTAMAQQLYGKENITTEERRKAKTFVYAWSYGAGVATLAATAGIPEREVRQLLESLNFQFPKLTLYSDKQLYSIESNGYVESVIGRKVFFGKVPAWELGEYKTRAKDYPIQMSAADSMKMAINLFEEKAKDIDHRLDLQVHDEMVVEAPIDRAEETKSLIEESMAQIGKELCPDVPIVAEATISDTWEKD